MAEKTRSEIDGKASACSANLWSGRAVVTKEGSLRRVAETVVSGCGADFRVCGLRRALRDDAKQPRYLKTIHRRVSVHRKKSQ